MSKWVLTLFAYLICVCLAINVKEENNKLLITSGELSVTVPLDQFAVHATRKDGPTISMTNLNLGQFLGVFLPLYEGYLFQFGVDTYRQHGVNTVSWSNDDKSVFLTVASTASFFTHNHTYVVFLIH